MAAEVGSSNSRNRRQSQVVPAQLIGDGNDIEDDDLRGFFINFSGSRGKQIKFPNKFTARWGYLIDQEVILTSKHRYRHLIGVERRNGNIWLGHGWEAFAQEYNIQVVPDEFTMAYGARMQNPTTLGGPDLVEWPVECGPLVGSLCFTEGWTEFVINYNIKRMD